MNVIQINAVFGKKSTGVVVQGIDDLLTASGEKSYIVCSDSTVMRDGIILMHNRISQKLHAFRTRFDGKQGYGLRCATFFLIRRFKKIRPDVIHLHNIHSNFIHYPMLIKYVKKERIPLVLTLHDCWFMTGKCYHFYDIGCEKWKTQCNRCPKRYSDIPSRMIDSSRSVFSHRKALFDYDKLYVVGCSEWITGLAKQSPILKKAQTECIRNGIDTEIFCPDKRVLRDERSMADCFVLLVMANKWFLGENAEVRNAILSSLSDKDRLMIVGCSQEQEKEMSKNNHVMTFGYLSDRQALATIYSAADVFVNLTHIDTLPTVNMEAAACGTPVVTFDAGGSGELVSEGKTGFVVKVSDTAGILKAIEEVRCGKIQRKDCAEYAKKQFDRETNFKKYIALYKRIAGTEKINGKGL